MKMILFFVCSLLSVNGFSQLDADLLAFRVGHPGVPMHFVGNYVLGTENAHNITLDDKINVDVPQAYFYVTLTVNDTTTECRSRGGSNNSLWTYKIYRRVVGNSTRFLVFAVWDYRNYRNTRSGDFNVLGSFHVGLYRIENPSEQYANVSFRLLKKRNG